jgi:putative heme-binding domain-containing protein
MREIYCTESVLRQSIARAALTITIALVSVVLISAEAANAASNSTDRTSAARNIEVGKSLFEHNCVVCHGFDGSGGRGPNLHRAHLVRASDEETLRNLIKSGIPPEMPSGVFFTDDDVISLAAFVRSLGLVAASTTIGDAAHGAELFAQSGCPSCHVMAGRGNAYGPELTQVSDRRSAAYLRDAILDPARNLPTGFLMVKVMTRQGGVIEGIRVNEDVFSIQVKDSRGTYISFRKTELRKLVKLQGTTPMPSFWQVLTISDIEDLVAYLAPPSASS